MSADRSSNNQQITAKAHRSHIIRRCARSAADLVRMAEALGVKEYGAGGMRTKFA
jgi:hypothetical protein